LYSLSISCPAQSNSGGDLESIKIVEELENALADSNPFEFRLLTLQLITGFDSTYFDSIATAMSQKKAPKWSIARRVLLLHWYRRDRNSLAEHLRGESQTTGEDLHHLFYTLAASEGQREAIEFALSIHPKWHWHVRMGMIESWNKHARKLVEHYDAELNHSGKRLQYKSSPRFSNIDEAKRALGKPDEFRWILYGIKQSANIPLEDKFEFCFSLSDRKEQDVAKSVILYFGDGDAYQEFQALEAWNQKTRTLDEEAFLIILQEQGTTSYEKNQVAELLNWFIDRLGPIKTSMMLRNGFGSISLAKNYDQLLDALLRLPPSPTRRNKIKVVLHRWHNDDPNAAMEWANDFGDQIFIEDLVERELQKALDEGNPQKALSIYESLEVDRGRSQLLSTIIGKYGRFHINKFIAWAESLPGEQERDYALTHISHAWAQQDAYAVLEYAKSLEQGKRKTTLLREAGQSIALSNPMEAINLALDADDPETKKQIAGTAYRTIAKTDPLIAINDCIERFGSNDEIVKRVARDASYQLAQLSLSETFEILVRADPRIASPGLTILFEAWSRSDLQTALKIVLEMEKGPLRDAAILGFSENGYSNIKQVIDILSLLSDSFENQDVRDEFDGNIKRKISSILIY